MHIRFKYLASYRIYDITMKPVLSLKDVSKKYKLDTVEVAALDDVSMQIGSGEYVSVMGPSGSGKSTLLNIMGLLDRPTSGKVFLDGKNVIEFDDNELAQIRGGKIGFVFQFFNLYPTLSALENVQLPMVLTEKYPDSRERRAAELLKKVGLEKRLNSLPSQLSGGERQRVAVARALANDPLLILADEPTGNLDSKTGKEVLKLFNTLHKEGRTVVIVTHDKNIADETERIIRISDGKVVAR